MIYYGDASPAFQCHTCWKPILLRVAFYVYIHFMYICIGYIYIYMYIQYVYIYYTFTMLVGLDELQLPG